MTNIQLKIKRFDKELPLPVYKTGGAVCVDLCARETMEILPSEIGYIPLNVAIKVPDDCWTLLAARSSTHKMGLIPANGIGIIDRDYCGDGDELKFAALNFTKEKVVVEKGTRVAQMIVLKRDFVQFEEVDHLDETDRGGFGTTGNLA